MPLGFPEFPSTYAFLQKTFISAECGTRRAELKNGKACVSADVSFRNGVVSNGNWFSVLGESHRHRFFVCCVVLGYLIRSRIYTSIVML